MYVWLRLELCITLAAVLLQAGSPRPNIGKNSPGSNYCIRKCTFRTRRRSRYTAACKQFYLPSPRHGFLHCSIKGQRLFSLFPAKWILYHPCVCKSNLCLPECNGGLLLISHLWKSSARHIPASQISHLLDGGVTAIVSRMGRIYFTPGQ